MNEELQNKILEELVKINGELGNYNGKLNVLEIKLESVSENIKLELINHSNENINKHKKEIENKFIDVDERIKKNETKLTIIYVIFGFIFAAIGYVLDFLKIF